jgi:ELWxxDGT repeat protein
MVAVDGSLYFVASDDTHGAELWSVGDTAGSEALVRDIRSGSTSSSPADLCPAGGGVVFTADDGVSGRELWRTDGTPAGTALLRDVRPGIGSSSPGQLTVLDGMLYFTADDGTSGRELWRSDGTEAGTWRVVDLQPGAGSSAPEQLTVSGSALYFVATPPGAYGRELWRTDGTEAGTLRLTGLYAASGGGSNVVELEDVGGTLFFSTNGAVQGLWRSDGTAAGTQLVRASLDYRPEHLTAVEARVFFTAAVDPSTREDQELWVSDGTAIGTRLVRDIRPGGLSSFPSDLTALGNALLFTADDGEHGRELWTSDGTRDGTRLVADLGPGAQGSSPRELVVYQGGVYFAADDGATGRELWMSDGTEIGTVSVADLRPGVVGSTPTALTPGNGTLYFAADDGVHGQQAWWLPATPRLVIRPARVIEGDTGTTDLLLTVSLLFPPAGTVTVDYATADGSAVGGEDYESLSGTLVFPLGEWQGTIAVPVRGDTLLERDETFRLELSNPSGATLATLVAEARIVDDDGAVVTVSPPGGGSRLSYSAVLSGGALASTSSPQPVELSFAGEPASWSSETTTTGPSGWLEVSPSSGAGPTTLTFAIRDVGGFTPGVFLASARFSGPGILNSAVVDVVLTVTAGPSRPPFGYVDTPLEGAEGMQGAVAVTGWALDDLGVTKVELYRDPLSGEATRPNGKVYVGDATFVPGARPDLTALHPGLPNATRAGWGYMLLTNMLPGQGNGSFVLHAYAYDGEGLSTLLGSRSITCANATATKPFGTIDTPGQGETISGTSYRVYGWALTPPPAAIPTDGSTIQVFVDGSPVGHPTYNLYRADIAALFPGYANSDGAVGYLDIDTTALANGLHTIAWAVTDDQGRVDGIGSRYFWVQN